MLAGVCCTLMCWFVVSVLQAAMIDKWEVSDIQTDKVFREIAEQQLGPILEVRVLLEVLFVLLQPPGTSAHCSTTLRT